MKKSFKLNTLALATTLAVSALAIPTFAQAEVSSDLTISSMYLWRGLDISDGKPALSSTIQYDHESGFYVGTWFTNEGTPSRDVAVVGAAPGATANIGTNGQSYELDAYLGYTKSFGDFGLDVGYVAYLYPEAQAKITDSDISEYYIGGSYKDLSVTAYINTDATAFDDYKYYSIDYSYNKFGFHYGMTDVSSDGGDYNDMNISYAVTDEMTWTISQASGDAITGESVLDEPLIVISYAVPLK